MKSSGWIRFENKTPYSGCYKDRVIPYDFPVVVAISNHHEIVYKVLTASIATERYDRGDRSLIAWMSFESFSPYGKDLE